MLSNFLVLLVLVQAQPDQNNVGWAGSTRFWSKYTYITSVSCWPALAGKSLWRLRASKPCLQLHGSLPGYPQTSAHALAGRLGNHQRPAHIETAVWTQPASFQAHTDEGQNTACQRCFYKPWRNCHPASGFLKYSARNRPKKYFYIEISCWFLRDFMIF